MGHATIHFCVEVGYIRETIGVICCGKDSFAEVFTDFIAINIKCRCELDIVYVISSQIHVHQARHEIIGLRVFVVLHPLHKGTGTVARADNCDSYFFVHGHFASLLLSTIPYSILMMAYLSKLISRFSVYITISFLSLDCYELIDIFSVSQLTPTNITVGAWFTAPAIHRLSPAPVCGRGETMNRGRGEPGPYHAFDPLM